MTDIYFVKSDIHFTKTEKKLIEYIIASPQEFIRMSIGDIARRIGTSEPTVSRFARHCGYNDFKNSKALYSGTCQKRTLLPESSFPHWEMNPPQHRTDFSGASSTVLKKPWNSWIWKACIKQPMHFLKLKIYIFMPKGPLFPWRSCSGSA